VNVDPGRVATASSIGSQGMPQCEFTAKLAPANIVKVTATIDTAPQAYFRLERTVVEASQSFSSASVIAAPVSVSGLGIDAAWFPDGAKLMTTDGARLITVAVSSPASDHTGGRALAESVARAYLGPARLGTTTTTTG
jgi:hypothetical protein